MITSASLLAALGSWGAGRLVLELVDRLTRRRHSGMSGRTRLETHSLALLLGLGLAAALLLTLGLGMPIASLGRAAGTSALVLALVAGLVVSWRQAGRPPELPAAPWRLDERLGAGLLVVFALFALFYGATMPMHLFDPVFHFAYKGKLLYHEGLMGPGWTDVEGSIGRVITHPDYPPGVGAIEALVSLASGHFDADAARPLFALFVLAMAGLLFARLRELSRRAAITGSLMWLALPFLYYSRLPHSNWLKGAYGLFFGPEAGVERFGVTIGPRGPVLGEWLMPDGWTLDGAGDLPLAALFSAAALLFFAALLRPREERRASDLILAGLLFGAAALMKNEGLALLPVGALAGLCAWLVSPRATRRSAKSALGSLALVFGTALVVASPWLAVRGSVPKIGEDYPSRLSPSGLVEALHATQPVLSSGGGGQLEDRAVPRIVAGGFLDTFSSLPCFGLTWVLFFGALVLGLLRPQSRPNGPPLAAALAVLGATALYALVLLVTPWDLKTLFQTAIPDRLVLHVAPLAIFALVSILTPREDDARA